MKYRRKERDTPGGMRLLGVRPTALHWRDMITKTAQCRALALTVWEKHGIKASATAFSVAPSTLYRWRKRVEKGKGYTAALNPTKRTRVSLNRRVTDWRIKQWILDQREIHPRMGKAKLTPLLKVQCLEWGIPAPSESTVGRILGDLKRAGKLLSGETLMYRADTQKHYRKQRKKRKKKRRKDYPVMSPGDLVEIDTITLYRNSVKRYILTAIDVRSRITYAKAYTRCNSKNATDFFKELEEVLPFTIKAVQTDNGSEFEKYFRVHLEREGITHYHTYPHCPRMNGHIERFNRTLQEEHANYHLPLLFLDLEAFNRLLTDYLTWYTTTRPHHSLGQKPPAWYISSVLTENSQ